MPALGLWLTLASGKTSMAQPPPASNILRIRTDDGLTLAAEQWLPAADAQPAAGVLLLHSFGNSRKAWGALPLALAEAGYRVLAIDLRSHGGSQPMEGARELLLVDPRLAPNDLRAGLQWLRAAPGADPSRLAVIGASVGANLACVASGHGLVRTAVALSPHRDRAHLLAGTRPLHMESILFLVGSEDPGREALARRLSLETGSPKDVHVFKGAEHGEALLTAHPEAIAMIIGWLRKTL